MDPATNPQHLKQLEEWLRSYRPAELFDESGRLMPELAALAPRGDKRMGANPNANGGLLLRDLRMPNFAEHAVEVSTPGILGIGNRCCGGPIRGLRRLDAAGDYRLRGETAGKHPGRSHTICC
jgi:xylulose-5-phosphate/fructose-6-phosphate phosphoketolase